MAYTLTLDDNWDITLDGAGIIAVSGGAYAVAQNVAAAIRLFTNDSYYDTDSGIPHFEIALGKLPNSSVIRSRYKKAALTVEGVAAAEVEVTSYDGRTCKGNIFITLASGETANIAF